MDSLPALRRGIDALDDRILALLNRRAALVERVYACKRREAQGAMVRAFVPAREEEIHRRLTRGNPGPFPKTGVRAVFREVISACRSLEGAFTVVYQGPVGSAGYRAALDCFGRSARLAAAPSGAAVRRLLESGRAAYGVVPERAQGTLEKGGFEAWAHWRDPLGGGGIYSIVGRPRGRP